MAGPEAPEPGFNSAARGKTAAATLSPNGLSYRLTSWEGLVYGMYECPHHLPWSTVSSYRFSLTGCHRSKRSAMRI
jgi:hypothetical protein